MARRRASNGRFVKGGHKKKKGKKGRRKHRR
jgi:hypothetical protein